MSSRSSSCIERHSNRRSRLPSDREQDFDLEGDRFKAAQ